MHEVGILKVHAWTGVPSFEIDGDPHVEPQTRAEIDRIWDAAVAERPGLFDGPTLVVTAICGKHFRLARATYRHVVAIRKSPALRAELRMRPLAVSGILACPDGVVFGRRAPDVATNAGLWELVPSGSVEPPLCGSVPDLRTQIARELDEEIGLSEGDARIGVPLGGIENRATGVFDIVFPLVTGLSAALVCAAHETRGSSEYDRLLIAPTFADDEHLLPESQLILATWLKATSFGTASFFRAM